MEHKNCKDLENLMADELIRRERIIKAYRNMLLALNMAPTILDKIEDGANKKL